MFDVSSLLAVGFGTYDVKVKASKFYHYSVECGVSLDRLFGIGEIVSYYSCTLVHLNQTAQKKLLKRMVIVSCPSL